MKRTLIVLAGFLLSFTYSLAGYAQNRDLVTDQNPNYDIARDKYVQSADSLTKTQGSTVQDTYKAYDWYEAKQERRSLRKERNHLERLHNPSYYSNSYYGLGSSYYSPWGNNWNRYRYNYGW